MCLIAASSGEDEAHGDSWSRQGRGWPQDSAGKTAKMQLRSLGFQSHKVGGQGGLEGEG